MAPEELWVLVLAAMIPLTTVAAAWALAVAVVLFVIRVIRGMR